MKLTDLLSEYSVQLMAGLIIGVLIWAEYGLIAWLAINWGQLK